MLHLTDQSIGINKSLQEGRYEYKYIVDGEWTYNNYELVTSPNKDGHVNNYVQVSFSFDWCPARTSFAVCRAVI